MIDYKNLPKQKNKIDLSEIIGAFGLLFIFGFLIFLEEIANEIIKLI